MTIKIFPEDTQHEEQQLENIIVVLLSQDVAIDPVALSIYEDNALKAYASNPSHHVAFILEKKDEAGTGYYYLKVSDSHVSERYLFSPMRFAHFKKRKQCEELWHGCKIPNIESIKNHAKILRLQEL